MTRFIFVRHGQSIGNLTGRFLGQYDGALTDLGRRQAERAAEFLRDERIDEAFASDLSRAYETGKIIAEPHGIIPVPDKALREIGVFKNRGDIRRGLRRVAERYNERAPDRR